MVLAWSQIERARAKQKRKALQMLALSGVVRPGHIEPRYSVPLLKLKGFSHAPTSVASVPLQPSRAPGKPSVAAAADRKHIMASLAFAQISLLQLFRRIDDPSTGTART